MFKPQTLKALILIPILWVAIDSFGKSVEGIIRSSGSKINYRIIIKEKGGSKDHTLCPGKVSDQINQYKRMHAKVTVTEGKQCLTPSSFQLVKTANGRDPVVGTLTKEGEYFAITHNGKKFLLEKIPKRLKIMENKKVVLDLAKSLSKKNTGNLYNVLFFAPAPELGQL
jgi:hypothetical protein